VAVTWDNGINHIGHIRRLVRKTNAFIFGWSKSYMGVDRTILQSKEIFIFDIFEAPQDGH
jgi:hypothetical protein